jgi:hypothetical protein
MITSLPFLKIARDYGVPYGQVIRYAESVWPQLCRNPNATKEMTAIHDAVIDERIRRQEVIVR